MSLNQKKHSATGTRTRVARVRAEYPNQLDYSGCCINLDHGPLQQLYGYEQMPALGKDVCTPLLTFRPTPIPTLCHWAWGHANLLWIVPIWTDDPRRGSEMKTCSLQRTVIGCLTSCCLLVMMTTRQAPNANIIYAAPSSKVCIASKFPYIQCVRGKARYVCNTQRHPSD